MDADANGHGRTAQAPRGEPLRIADAKTHMVVAALINDEWEDRYLYKDADGWYVHNDGVRFYITSTDGVTLDGVKT